MDLNLPTHLKTLLESASLPLEQNIKNQQKKDILCNDFLLVSRKINYLFGHLFDVLYNPLKNEIKSPDVLIELLLHVFSNIVLLNYICSAGWKCGKHLSPTQEKELNSMLRDLSVFSKEFSQAHRK